MKINKWLVPFGMVGVLSFLLLDILGKILWPEYNPVTTYVSTLVTNEAPHANLMRFFLNTYTVCFLLFSLGMTALSLRAHHMCVRIGYTIMLATASIMAVGFGAYPISMALIFSKDDVVHVVVTVSILCLTVLAVLLAAIGYLKREKLKILGRISLSAGIFYVAFNLWHLYEILNGHHNILGLIERFIFYTFHALTFILSWAYTFRKNELVEYADKKTKTRKN